MFFYLAKKSRTRTLSSEGSRSLTNAWCAWCGP